MAVRGGSAGCAGANIVIVGFSVVLEGIREKFEKQLRMNELRGAVRAVVTRLAIFGPTVRGIVFAFAGALVAHGAAYMDSSRLSGLDGALRNRANRAYGPSLLGGLALDLLAIGLIAVGRCGLASACVAKTCGCDR